MGYRPHQPAVKLLELNPRALVAEHRSRLGCVLPYLEAREGLERGRKGHRIIDRILSAPPNAKTQRRGPTAHIAINGVNLFLHKTILQIIELPRSRSPILIEPE